MTGEATEELGGGPRPPPGGFLPPPPPSLLPLRGELTLRLAISEAVSSGEDIVVKILEGSLTRKGLVVKSREWLGKE